MMGGFALQKVAAERSYFRTIANMDIKLDFVPPSLINFISRQLIGSGFRLYQKAVASMMSHDEEFSKALGDPLYARIREALYDINGSKRALDGEEVEQSENILPGEDLIKVKQDESKGISQPQEDKINQYAEESTPMDAIVTDNSKAFSEIEELGSDETVYFEEHDMKVNDTPMDKVEKRSPLKNKENVYVSSEVEQALDTLEKAISMVKKYRFHSRKYTSDFTNEESPHKEKGDTTGSYSPKPQVCSKSEVSIEVSNKNILEGLLQQATGTFSGIHNLRQTGTNPNLKEANNKKVVPASSKQNLSRPNEANQVALCSLKNEAKDMPTVEIQDISSDEPKKKSRRGKCKYCCFLSQIEKEKCSG